MRYSPHNSGTAEFFMLLGPNVVNLLIGSCLLILQIFQPVSVPLSGSIQEGLEELFSFIFIFFVHVTSLKYLK